MFDLLPETRAQKKSAFAASFLAQSAAAGVLVLIPLISHEVLPVIQLATQLPALYRPSAPPQPTPMPKHRVTSRRLVPLVGIFAPRAILNRIPFEPEALEPAEFDPLVPDAGTLGGTAVNSGPSVIPLQPPAVRPQVVEGAKPVVTPVQVPVVVTSEIQAAKIIKRVIPQYPPIAKQTRLQGTVRLTGIIAKDGTIQQLQLISGHPLLAPAAMEAVRQWVYRPTVLNGQPVEVIAPIDVTFALQR